MTADEATGVERIAGAFAHASGRAALMPYLMAGYPTLAQSAAIGEACVRAGADLLELGVPYSDPLADGPVIHAAGTRALAAGANVAGVLEVARVLAPSVPVVLMCYANMVFAPGVDAFVERLARSGACGLIVPDLPFEEAATVHDACESHGLALVPLVAPTTPPERRRSISARAEGFVYLVSDTRVTGERDELPPGLTELINEYQKALDPATKLFLMEFALHGLAEYSMISKHYLSKGLQFKDLISGMFSVPKEGERDDDAEEDDDQSFGNRMN